MVLSAQILQYASPKMPVHAWPGICEADLLHILHLVDNMSRALCMFWTRYLGLRIKK